MLIDTKNIDTVILGAGKPRKKKNIKIKQYKNISSNPNQPFFDYLNKTVFDESKYAELNRMSKEWTEENIKNQKLKDAKKKNQTHIINYNQDSNIITVEKVPQKKAPIQKIVDVATDLPGTIMDEVKTGIENVAGIDWTKIMLWGGLAIAGFLIIMLIVKK